MIYFIVFDKYSFSVFQVWFEFLTLTFYKSVVCPSHTKYSYICRQYWDQEVEEYRDKPGRTQNHRGENKEGGESRISEKTSCGHVVCLDPHSP